jgi:hypothetical protein
LVLAFPMSQMARHRLTITLGLNTAMNGGIISGIIVDISVDSPSSLPEGSMRLKVHTGLSFQNGEYNSRHFAGEEVAAKISWTTVL